MTHFHVILFYLHCVTVSNEMAKSAVHKHQINEFSCGCLTDVIHV